MRHRRPKGPGTDRPSLNNRATPRPYAREIVVPLAPGLFGFIGLGQLQPDMAQVRRFLENKALRLFGVVLVLTERTAVSRDFERQVREMYGDAVFRATIPRSVKFEEANARLLPIGRWARLSPGALAYEALTLEVMSRGHEEQRTDAPRGHLPADDAA
jgi:chromosome partitioning protein